MRPTPLQTVKKNFESREKLVAQLAELIDLQHGDTTREEAKARLMGLSNQKLLRRYAVEQAVRERYGDRAKLLQHLIDARKKAGHAAGDDFKTKLEGYTKARLLDMTHQKFGERPAKRTPQEKLASKHGRKERQRAMSKMAHT